MRKREEGFGIIEWLLLLLILLLLGFAGWWVYARNNKTETKADKAASSSTEKSKSASDAEEKSTLTIESLKASLQYPKAWKVTKQSEEDSGKVTIDSGDAVKIVIDYGPGGFGGVCDDGSGEPAGAEPCPTIEYLKVTELAADNTTLAKVEGEKIYLVHTKITNNVSNETKYYGCLISKLENTPIEENQPAQQFGSSCGTPWYIALKAGEFGAYNYISIRIEGSTNTSATFYDSADYKSAEEVLKTFKLGA